MNLPSLVAPILTLMLEPGVGPVLSNSSVLVWTIFTGRSVFLDSSAATGSPYGSHLPPKPPPISIGVNLALTTSSPSICAVWSRTSKGAWVEFQM